MSPSSTQQWTRRIRYADQHIRVSDADRNAVAEQLGALTGFVTIDRSGYLDQLVVGTDRWGSDLGNTLIAEAKRLSPDGITLKVNTDNTRAIRFYQRNGFVHAGEDVNAASGRPVLRMAWKP